MKGVNRNRARVSLINHSFRRTLIVSIHVVHRTRNSRSYHTQNIHGRVGLENRKERGREKLCKACLAAVDYFHSQLTLANTCAQLLHYTWQLLSISAVHDRDLTQQCFMRRHRCLYNSVWVCLSRGHWQWNRFSYSGVDTFTPLTHSSSNKRLTADYCRPVVPFIIFFFNKRRQKLWISRWKRFLIPSGKEELFGHMPGLI